MYGAHIDVETEALATVITTFVADEIRLAGRHISPAEIEKRLDRIEHLLKQQVGQ
jgi:hypothetical protein